MFILSLGQWKYAKSIAYFAKRRYNYKKYWRIKRVGTTQQLNTEQEDILYLLSKMDEIHILDCNDNEKIYRVALESFSYVPDEVDTIIKELQGFGYIDNENEITPNGTNYLKHNTIKEKQEKIKKKKINSWNAKIKLVGGVVALLATIVTTILAIYSAFKN